MVQLKSESFLYDGHRTICCLPPLSDVNEIPEEVPVVFRCMRNKGKKSSWEAEGYQSSEGRLRILDCFREIFWPNSGSMAGRIRPVCMSTSLNTAVWTNTKWKINCFCVVGPIFNPREFRKKRMFYTFFKRYNILLIKGPLMKGPLYTKEPHLEVLKWGFKVWGNIAPFSKRWCIFLKGHIPDS